MPGPRLDGNVHLRGAATSGHWRVTLNPLLPAVWAKDPYVIAQFKNLAEFGKSMMKQRVPVRTGKLYKSLDGKVSHAKGTIAVILKAGGPGAEHWIFVEYGTGQRGRQSPEVANTPRPRGYTHGPSAGMAAQPYMRPAMLDIRKRMR